MLNWLGSLKCPDCGGRITEQEKYCPHCGADLDAPVRRSHEEALEYFERARKTYDRNGSMRDALLDCELALQYNPEFAEAHNLHGLILDALEKPQKAIQAYHRALELDPNLEDARANIMDFEAEQNEWKAFASDHDRLEGDSGNLKDAKEEQNQPQHVNEYSSVYRPKNYNIEGIFKTTLWIIIFIFLCSSVAFFGKTAIQYLGPKSTVVFEADNSLVTSVKKADLEATAAILTERCQQLGYKNISFHVSDQNEIIGEVPTALNPQKIADEIKTIGLLEFVDFGDKPQNTGMAIRTDFNNKYFPTSLEPGFHTILSNEAINASAVTEGQIEKTYAISFVLTDKASKIFTEYTTSHRGEYLGIVLDTIVVSSPVINEPITGGEGSISGNFTEEEAVHLAAILQTKPLPIPIKVKQIINN
jgi:hypothetical protein